MTPRQRAEKLYQEIMRIDTPGDRTDKWIAMATTALQAQANETLEEQRGRMGRARRHLAAAQKSLDGVREYSPRPEENVDFQDLWIAIDNAKGEL